MTLGVSFTSLLGPSANRPSLEGHLGRKLLRRHSGGYSLAADALVGLQDLRDAFERLSLAAQKISAADQRMLRISTVPSLAAAWLVPRLPRFRERHPALDVRLHASYEMVDFEHAPFDMAIQSGGGAYPGLASHRLFVDEIFPVCSPQLFGRAEIDGSVGKWLVWPEWLRAAGVTGVNATKGPRFSDGAMSQDQK